MRECVVLVLLGIGFNAGSVTDKVGIRGRKDVIDLHQRLSGFTRPSGMSGGYLEYSEMDGILGDVLLDNWWCQDDAASNDSISEYAKTCSVSLLDQIFSTFLSNLEDGRAPSSNEERMGFVLHDLAEIVNAKLNEISGKYRRIGKRNDWTIEEMEKDVLFHSLNGYLTEKQLLVELTKSLRDCPESKLLYILRRLKSHMTDLVYTFGIKPSDIESVIRNSFPIILS